jgi:hypothetical protein
MAPSNFFDVLGEAAAAHGDREFLIVGKRLETASLTGPMPAGECSLRSACSREIASRSG